MAFGLFKIVRGILIKEEGTNTPKQIEITPGGTANTKTTITSSQTTNRTVTLPDAATTLVGTDATQTLTNKSIDADANTITNIENADIKAGANIARNKLASGTADRVLVNDGSGVLSDSTVTTTELNKLSGLSGNITTDTNTQTLTNKTIDADSNTITNIENADIKAGAAIDASKLADGSVSNTEFQYINSLTSNAQTQLDGKVDESLYTAKGVILAATGANTPATLPVGTNGQVLTADSAEATGVKWASAGTASPLTTKGDLYTYSTTNDRLPVGTNGQILSADSAETTGLKWIAAPVTGANTTLSNLTSPTAVNQDVLPDTDNTRDLGSGAARFAETHTQTVVNTGANLTLQSTTGKIAISATSVDMPASSSDPSATESDLYYNTGLDKFKYHDGTQWRIMATRDEFNFILNAYAESSTTGWATYADAAAASPVDGTGGSPNVTISVSNTTPLTGVNSFLLVKDAANRQGQGWSYDFTIDNASKSKVLQIQFDSIVSSGTFVAGGASSDSDVTVWIYDITNARLIQPTTYKIFGGSSTVANKFISNFQSSADSTSYRLIFHVSTTSASAYTLKVDNVVVSPTTLSYGTPITDWVSYTPTFTGFGTPTNVVFAWRRIGDSAQIMGRFTSGTSTATASQITLPSGLTVNTIINLNRVVGFTGYSQSSSSQRQVVANGGNAYFQISAQDGSNNGLTASNGSTIMSSGESLTVFLNVPIQGWSAQVQSSDVNDQRIVAARYKATAAKSVSTTQPLDFDTKVIDTHSAVTTGSSWKFTAPISGTYRVTSTGMASSVSPAIRVYKNGTFYANGGEWISSLANWSAQVDVLVDMVAGDYIDIRASNSLTTDNVADSTYVDVIRIANPASITSSETVAARFKTTSSKSASTTQPIDFDSKDYDTHNAVTTGSSWKFTAPISGIYSVQTAVMVSNATPVLSLYKNGALVAFLGQFANAPNWMASGSTSIQLLAGDYIDIRVSNSVSTDNPTNGVCCHVAINRIGL